MRSFSSIQRKCAECWQLLPEDKNTHQHQLRPFILLFFSLYLHIVMFYCFTSFLVSVLILPNGATGFLTMCSPPPPPPPSQVIYALNTKNDEHEAAIATLKEAHEEEVQQILSETREKILQVDMPPLPLLFGFPFSPFIFYRYDPAVSLLIFKADAL